MDVSFDFEADLQNQEDNSKELDEDKQKEKEQKEQEMDREGDEDLLLASLVDGAYVRHSIASDIVADDDVDQADEKVLAIFRAFIRKVSAEWIQN